MRIFLIAALCTTIAYAKSQYNYPVPSIPSGIYGAPSGASLQSGNGFTQPQTGSGLAEARISLGEDSRLHLPSGSREIIDNQKGETGCTQTQTGSGLSQIGCVSKEPVIPKAQYSSGNRGVSQNQG